MRTPFASLRLFACAALASACGTLGWIGCGGSDGGPLLAGDDASADASPNVDATGSSDAGTDGPTVTCTPHLTGTPSWKPPSPTYPMNACTTTQVATLLADCYSPTYDQAKCDADKTALADCWKCIVTPESATSLGPIIAQGEFSTVNFPGCIALEQVQLGLNSCGGSQGIALDCQMLSCANPCSGLDAGSSSRVDAYNACMDQVIADGGACLEYEQGINCPASDPSYAVCYRNGATEPFQVYAARVIGQFCVGPDGGVTGDAGGTDASDAGAEDASDGATPSDASTDAPDGD